MKSDSIDEDEVSSGKVVHLAERAPETLDITELEPRPDPNGHPIFIGKKIAHSNKIISYPTNVTWYGQAVATIPATIPALFAYLREARTRNICLIRGTPANLERQWTRRQNAGLFDGKDRGDHGFTDEPTKLFFLDIDDMPLAWRDDPQEAIRTILTLLGEPWASTSCVWFFSGTHGLERGKDDKWTGGISDGVLSARIAFITDRALTWGEASALTKIAKVKVPQLDPRICVTTQPNYIKRPLWMAHPEADPLGEIPTIGRIKGERETLEVPDNLLHLARWVKAQGHNVDIADHPDAEAAVRGIGSDGRIRQHLMSAVMHLLLANEVDDVTSFDEHAHGIVRTLRKMITQHHDEIDGNLTRERRRWAEVDKYLSGMTTWAMWLLHRPAALKRKTIKLIKETRIEEEANDVAEAIYARVRRGIEHAYSSEVVNKLLRTLGREPVTLLVAPTGSRKSTLMREIAVRYVQEHPDESVVLLVDRHKLGDEQVRYLHREHPNADFSAAVWRGRHADDPESLDTKGKLLKMCQRSDEATELEEAKLDVDHHLCKQGRGMSAIFCPLFDVCGYQRQKRVEANIWFGAHELMVHKMPKAFGNVGLVLIDESPIDAFMFGIDINDTCELALDKLRDPPPSNLKEQETEALSTARKDLYEVLDKLITPIDKHLGVPVPVQSLGGQGWGGNESWMYSAKQMSALEWKGKVIPDIRPNMSRKQVKEAVELAADNGTTAMRAMLWHLVDDALQDDYSFHCGRIQVHRSKQGRIIRMVGLRPLAKGWKVRTLITDATGDVELLKAIWSPRLVNGEEHDGSVEEFEPCGWQQMPRPKSVRVFQCVDRSFSKWALAIEGKNKKSLERKVDSARKVYAALLHKALEYGGAKVGAVVYKSTKDWILENCHVPEWLTLTNHGATRGTNALEDVRALFIIGRPLASGEDVSRMIEALFGKYVEKRDYGKARKVGRIPLVPMEDGTNVALVDVRKHQDPMGERMRRQVTEASQIQTEGRARAGLRGDDGPVDIHRWHDVPLPELGPVEAVLRAELDVGLDGLMLARGGVWLECIADAVKCYPELFKREALKKARAAQSQKAGNGGVGNPLIENPISSLPTPRHFLYHCTGKGKRPSRCVVLPGIDGRAWLEERLGPLVRFEVVAAPPQVRKATARRRS